MNQALLFDLDNTLVDRAEAHRAYWEDFLCRFPAALSQVGKEALLHDLIAQDEFGYRPRKAYFAWVATTLPHVRWDAEEFWENYQSRLANFIQPQPEVNQMIESLGHRYPLAIVSNGSSFGQRRKLEKSRLAAHFPNVFISGECGVEKPSPEIFLMALRQLGCAPSAALFIGDDPVRDIGGAARVGCRTCWISHGRPFPETVTVPTLSIPSITALPEALKVA